MLCGRDSLKPFSKSLIVISLRLAFAASRTRDQFSRARAALECFADSRIRLSMGPEHSEWIKCSLDPVKTHTQPGQWRERHRVQQSASRRTYAKARMGRTCISEARDVIAVSALTGLRYPVRRGAYKSRIGYCGFAGWTPITGDLHSNEIGSSSIRTDSRDGRPFNANEL